MRCDWVLVDGRIDLVKQCDYLCATLTQASGQTIRLHLPVLTGGFVHELICLPVTGEVVHWSTSFGTVIPEGQLVCRRAGWFERVWRMSYRVLRTWWQLSKHDRRRAGLTALHAIGDLPNAYRKATELRFPMPYEDWVAFLDTPVNAETTFLKSHVDSFSVRPEFHVVLYAVGAEVSAVKKSLLSLEEQFYSGFHCTVIGFVPIGLDNVTAIDADNLQSWLETFNNGLKAHPGWVIRINAGDVFAVNGLYRYACAIGDHPDSSVFYSDEDELTPSGKRVNPVFKPDWSLSHFRSTNYLGNAVALNGEALAAVGGFDEAACHFGVFEKVLEIIDLKEENVSHIPSVLIHRGSGGRTDVAAWELHAVQRHLVRRGIAASISPTLQGCRRIRYQLPASLPLVSIVIPTRNALEILRRCIDSVLLKTTYARYEVIVVDNQSRDAGTLNYLKEFAGHPVVRVLHFDKPFNFSAINNFASVEARGELLCLLNNDTEVITPDWLDEMVGHLLQDQVGVVGAKLFYPDGRVQHGGDTVGPGGCANHLHNGIARDDPGYCNRAVVAQDLSAVTAACLLTRRKLYLDLGGLDARWLRVAFNDVDYCLRVRAAGWRVVWTPHGELYHHESVSRGKNDNWRKILRSELEVAVMRRRWKHVMRNDPFYNPNLNYRQPDFTPGRTRRIKRPWD